MLLSCCEGGRGGIGLPVWFPGSDAGVFDREPDDPTGEGMGLSDEMEGCGEFEVGSPWELLSHDATSSQPGRSILSPSSTLFLLPLAVAPLQLEVLPDGLGCCGCDPPPGVFCGEEDRDEGVGWRREGEGEAWR